MTTLKNNHLHLFPQHTTAPSIFVSSGITFRSNLPGIIINLRGGNFLEHPSISAPYHLRDIIFGQSSSKGGKKPRHFQFVHLSYIEYLGSSNNGPPRPPNSTMEKQLSLKRVFLYVLKSMTVITSGVQKIFSPRAASVEQMEFIRCICYNVHGLNIYPHQPVITHSKQY